MHKNITRVGVALAAAVALSALGVSGAGAAGSATGAAQAWASTGEMSQALAATPGTQLWASRYNGPGSSQDDAYAVAVSPDGTKVFVTGLSYGGTATDFDYATIAYSTATGAQLWAKRYNGPGNWEDNAWAVAVSPDGTRVFVTGVSSTATESPVAATIAYSTATGAQLWVKRYAGGSGTSVAVSPDGSRVFVITGTTTVAYSAATGAQLWARRFGSGSDSGMRVAVSPAGTKVFVTGTGHGATTGEDYATIAYNAATGAQLWAKHYNGPANGFDHAMALAVNRAGTKVFVTGESVRTTSNPTYPNDYATVAYSAATGAQLWAKRYAGPGSSNASSVTVSPDGTKVFVTGTSISATSPYQVAATVAYSAATGGQLWVKSFNGLGRSVAVSPTSGKVYVTGSSQGATTGWDYATVAYSTATGAQLWAKRYNGPGNGEDAAYAVAVSRAGDKVFVTGTSQGATTSSDYATIAYSG